MEKAKYNNMQNKITWKNQNKKKWKKMLLG